MATSLARGGMLAARRGLACPSVTSVTRAVGSAVGAAPTALNVGDAAAAPAAMAASSQQQAAWRPFSCTSHCGAITQSAIATSATPALPLHHRRKPIIVGAPALSSSRRGFARRVKKPDPTQAEAAAAIAQYDDFDDDGVYCGDYLDISSLFKPDLSSKPSPHDDDDDDGGPVGGPRGGSSYKSPIGEDYSRMTNAQLADPSTIPGWDLIHTPPRKYPKGALVGRVVSDKMTKTVNVAIERYRVVPIYRKRRKYTKKFMAHDEGEVCDLGDMVMIVPCQQISKRKHFMVREIVRKGGAVR